MLLFNIVSVKESNHSLKIIKGIVPHERGNPGSVFVSVLPRLQNPARTSLLKKSKNKIFVNELKQEETSTTLTTAY